MHHFCKTLSPDSLTVHDIQNSDIAAASSGFDCYSHVNPLLIESPLKRVSSSRGGDWHGSSHLTVVSLDGRIHQKTVLITFIMDSVYLGTNSKSPDVKQEIFDAKQDIDILEPTVVLSESHDIEICIKDVGLADDFNTSKSKASMSVWDQIYTDDNFTSISLNVDSRDMEQKLNRAQDMTTIYSSENLLVTAIPVPSDKRYTKMLTGTQPFFCNICNRSFTHSYHLEQHLRLHYDDRPFVCDICRKGFKIRSNLIQHMRFHSGEKPYMCDVCHKCFTLKSNFDNHACVHSTERSFVCNICNKNFSTKSYLNQHLRSHSDEKPFLCNVCNKAFSLKCSLDSHIHIHKDERPFKCNLCKKAFTKQSNLQQHIRVHTGDRPFSCTICNKSFVQKAHLSKHLFTHRYK